MRFRTFKQNDKKMLWKPVVLVILTLAWANFAAADQHKPSAPAPSHSAPAPHASAPHPSAPSHSAAPQGHSNAPGHVNTMGHSNAPGHNTNTMGHANSPTTGHPNTMGHANAPGHSNAPNTAGHSNAPGHNTNTAHANTPTRGNPSGRTPPGRNVSLKGGGHASLRPDGHIRSVDRNGMHIERGVHGERRVVSEHNGARVVTYGRHGGYVQRAYVTRGGHSYYSRTYYDHGHYRSVVYRNYYYGGRAYYGYYPGYYYGPAYYGWAYNPWAAPVYWGVGFGGWGWGGSPWYGYYGGYFAPYPVYPSAAFWLTDYLISANLQAAYAARQEAQADAASNAGGGGDNGGGDNGGGGDAPQASNSGPVALTPEVKQAIAEEVKAQLAAEKAEAAQSGGGASGGQAPAAASGEVPAALDPARRTFVVSSDITVIDGNGQECALTSGDVLTRLTDTPDQDQKVNASVSASKKSDCPSGGQVAVLVDDLQEMHNHFQEQLDDGMKTLAAKQGTGGIPKAPDTSTKPSDVAPPPPDTSAGKALDDQQKAADQTESDVSKEAAAGGGGQ